MSASSRVFVLVGGLVLLAGCESIVGIREVEVERDPPPDDGKHMTSAGDGGGRSSSNADGAGGSDSGNADATDDSATPPGDDCNVVPGRIEACGTASTGSSREGAVCTGGCKCAAGLVCYFEVGETLGICIGVRKCGEPCTDDYECRSVKCSVKQCK